MQGLQWVWEVEYNVNTKLFTGKMDNKQKTEMALKKTLFYAKISCFRKASLKL